MKPANELITPEAFDCSVSTLDLSANEVSIPLKLSKTARVQLDLSGSKPMSLSSKISKAPRVATPIAAGYWRKANEVLAGFIRAADVVLRMKPITPSHRSGKGVTKRRKRLVKGAASAPPQGTVRIRRNDPLAIGIEELERSFWPSACGRRSLAS